MQTIEDWLSQHGLGKYAEAFVQNDVDLRALPHITESDLQELGVSLGHRKIILAAINGEGQPRLSEPNQGSATIKEPELRTAEMPNEPTADRRILSVLFCDLVGSTALSAQFDPEDMHELTRRYQDSVAGAVMRFGGYVAKYLGDGVLAYFGWPMAYEDHAERSIRAGLQALAAVETFQSPDGQQLQARIGIASGHVVVGDIAGSSANERGSIAGDTPNLAARLQAVAAPGQIVMADSTRRLAGQSFEIESLGAKELKGFKSSVALFAVRGEREVESRFDAAHGRTLSKFVGRANEIGMLLDRWELVKSGQGQAVFVSGEAGIGKSRLVEAFEERLHENRHELIRLQCSPYHATSAFYPIIQRLGRFAGFSATDNQAARADKLRTIVQRYGEKPLEVGSIYAELLSLDLGDEFKPLDLPPQQRKELIVRTLSNRVLLAAKIAPVLLVVEDAHWIDPSTDEVLKEIVGRLHGAAILVVVTHRPEWVADWAAGLAQATTLAIGRLTRQHMRELIESILADVPDQLAETIAKRTDGVPLFVEELTRSIIESGKAASLNVEIPDSLQGSLMARLDRLSAAAKEVAQIASVIGREFERGLLSKVAGRDERALDGALHQLMSTQLVVVGGILRDALVFRHALIQDTAYQSLLSRRRRHYHEAIAKVLIDEYPDLAVTQPELIAQHFVKAQQDELAFPYWMRAGERALGRSANYEAVDHFQNALAITENLPAGPARKEEVLEATLKLGEALSAAGRLSDSLAKYKLTADLAREAEDNKTFVRAALGFDGAQFLSSKPLGESLDLLTEAMTKIDPDDLRSRCQLLTRLARAHFYVGDRRNSTKCYKEGVDLARRLGDKTSLFELTVLPFLTPTTIQSGAEADERIARVDELKRLSADINDDDVRGRAFALDVYVSTELGNRARADSAVDGLEELGTERQRLNILWLARNARAMMAIIDGRFANAEALAGEALTLGRQTHGVEVEGVYGMQMFTIRREQNRLSEVAPVMKRFIEEDPDGTIWLPGFALIAADLGFGDAARRRLNELAQTGFMMPLDARRSTSLSLLAEVAVSLDDSAAARTIYDLMLEYKDMTITAGVATVCFGAASRYLGMLSATLGDFARASDHFEHAVEMNAAIGSRPWLAHAQAEYANLLLRTGNKRAIERAMSLAEQATVTAVELDMVRLQKRLQPTVH
ncbi:class 3 adenylate cyclase/tetratricopeptide (TPR) repeat protein [Mesorhizobium shonense]|uniref:Class 3 adenylate cyclase/tetratricopeptide (TPR) repeat protein n=1 Tax=Mesorhizobium shonense TaxID=1209948 RepID=A0ABV2I439_9HYPH|nr:adenylate/guanylate cyclase domain-containing protein [Mesorhizobium sp.]TIS45529.1 MAG: guanylate cyclase [Mesorhizobium sp.]